MKTSSQQVAFSISGRVTARWLVSVRDEVEFAQAVRFAVDIVDLKEPHRGALSPVEPDLWRRAAEVLSDLTGGTNGGWTPMLSAALGERDEAVAIAGNLPSQFAFAKAGPSGCDSSEVLRGLWADVKSRLHPSIALVAVAYADSDLAKCMEPESVLREAKCAGINACLLDTFTKNGQSTIQFLGIRRLAEVDRLAKRLGIWWALAGSITGDDVAVLTESGIQPDCFAVRGDVCEGDRTAGLSERRMEAWSKMFAGRER